MTDVLRRGSRAAHSGQTEVDPLSGPPEPTTQPVEPAWPQVRRRAPLELLLVMALAMLAAALAWFDGPPLLRLPIGLLAGLVLPGYSVSVALLPRYDDFQGAERLGLAFGLSLAIIVIMALALSYTPWELRATPVTLTLTGITLVAASTGWWRRSRHAPIDDHHTVGGFRAYVSAGWGARLAVCALAGGMALAGSALVFTLGSPPGPFTEFLILEASGLARDYPRGARAGEPMTVVVGINNWESQAATYTVTIEADGAILTATSPAEIAAYDGWEAPLTFTLPKSGKDQEIRILLFKDGAIEPYRQLRLWVDVHSATRPARMLAAASPTPQVGTTLSEEESTLGAPISGWHDFPSLGAL